MESLFGEENIYNFLEKVVRLVEQLYEQLKEEISELNDYSSIKEHLRGWKFKSSKEINELYDQLEPITTSAAKPEFEEFMENVASEFRSNGEFKSKIREIGETITELKEFIKEKIQDDLSIYKMDK